MARSPEAFDLENGGNIAMWDLVAGVRYWRLWAFLGLEDIRARYRRSSLGPLWLALGLGVMILGIGLLYSQILKAPAGTFIPFFAVSMWAWSLIGAVINESTGMFQASSGLLTAMRIPYSSLVLRNLTRNLIVFVHTAVPMVLAFIFYHHPIGWVSLLVVPGMLLIAANLYWISLAIGMICLRFRDVSQIVMYGTQLALFVTPILWQPTQIRPGSFIIAFNPIYHFIQIIRAPIFDGKIPEKSYVFCLVLLVVGMIPTVFAFVRLRRRMIFWM